MTIAPNRPILLPPYLSPDGPVQLAVNPSQVLFARAYPKEQRVDIFLAVQEPKNMEMNQNGLVTHQVMQSPVSIELYDDNARSFWFLWCGGDLQHIVCDEN